MAVELDGNVRMRGDTGPGVGVKVLAEHRRIRLVSGNELVGDWNVSEIGISALQNGFNVRAGGEEFILRTSDDAAFAEEIGVATASPRLARMIAARHNPELLAEVEEEAPEERSNLAALGFALAGALIVLGGVFLDGSQDAAALSRSAEPDGFDFWLAFIVGGVLMIGVAYVMSIGSRGARIVALVILGAMVVAFGFAVSGGDTNTSELTAYGFVAGGLVVGVAVLFSGSINSTDDDA